MDANNAANTSHGGPDSHPEATGVHLWTKEKKARSNKLRSFTPKAQESTQVKEKLRSDSYAKRYAEIQRDVRLLALTSLYSKYRGEYNSWRRAKNTNTRQEGVRFDYQAFSDFRNWLVHLGIRPSRDHTADRISFLKGYEPGNLRWSSKQEQAENRKSTRRIEWAGRRYTRREFAKFLSVGYKRLCKQLEREWPLSRIVAAAGKAIDPVEDFRFSNEALEREYWDRRDKYFTFNRIDWLVRFYEDHAIAAKRQNRREQFEALAADAARERKRRYAERDALQDARQEELIEQVAPSYPMFNPPPSIRAAACVNGEREAVCNQLHGPPPGKKSRTAKAKERTDAESLNAYLRLRTGELAQRGMSLMDAMSLALAEYQQLAMLGEQSSQGQSKS